MNEAAVHKIVTVLENLSVNCMSLLIGSPTLWRRMRLNLPLNMSSTFRFIAV